MEMKMCKRGQVTAFIILGIIMILAVMFFFYMRADITKITYDEKVPEGFIPLKRFVEQCMADETTALVQTAGQQGGYVDVPSQIRINPFSRVMISPQLDMVIPYWYYRRGGSIQDGDLSPEEDDMVAQIEANADREIVECVDAFSSFENLYNILEVGDLETTIKFTDNSVVVLVDFPFKVQDNTGQIVPMSRFRTELPLRIRKAHELAKEIFDAENNQMFLEGVTMDLMSMASKATDSEDSMPLVPMTDMVFGQCKPFMKSTARVKRNIQEMLPFNLDSVRVNETNVVPYEHPDYLYARNHFIWKTGMDKDDYKDFRVEFDYDPAWGMKLRTLPSQGGFLRAESSKLVDLDLVITRLTIPACFINYHFVYDIEYPVVVRIFDEQVVGEHDAYVYQFAMPVIINHNEGDKVNTPVKFLPDRVHAGGEYEFCENKDDRVTVYPRDEVSYEPLNKVNIRFSCIEFTCDMGRTVPLLTTAALETDFPRCNYGTIVAEKDGYFTKQIRGIDTENNDTIEFFMLKKKKLNLSVKKYLVGDTFKRFLADDESVILDIKNEEYGHQTSAFYSSESSFREFEIPVGEGLSYELEAMVLKSDNIVGGTKLSFNPSTIDIMNANELELYVLIDESLIDDYEAQINMLDNMTEFSKDVEAPVLK